MTLPEHPPMPRSLQRDGWWLSTPADGRRAGTTQADKLEDCSGRPARRHWLSALAMLVLADWLFWGYAPGLSLAVFALALVGAVLISLDRAPALRDGAVGGIILVASILPVIDYVQPLSLLFYGAGMIVLATWVGLGGQISLSWLLIASCRFMGHMPLKAVSDIVRLSQLARPSFEDQDRLSRLVQVWAVPLVMGGIFSALLIAGNPLLEQWVNDLAELVLGIEVNAARAGFWAAVALVIWPCLMIDGLRQSLLATMPGKSVSLPPTRVVLFSPASIASSLIAFNLVFAVQSSLDAVYLWGGAALPEGMTYAQYAHRGAYPLVATALLAGVFALLSRPYAEKRKWLKVLLELWLGQNLLLVISSLYRLDLYVSAYGLTYWRVAAVVWMGLVAAGLVLIAWQLSLRKSNLWLFNRNLIVLLVTLYGCTFVNFDSLIARYNLELAEAKHGLDQLDRFYICDLGPTAASVIVAFETRTGTDVCLNSELDEGLTASGWRFDDELMTSGWRSWGFRLWRTQKEIEALQEAKENDP